jgi:hypothetical protein
MHITFLLICIQAISAAPILLNSESPKYYGKSSVKMKTVNADIFPTPLCQQRSLLLRLTSEDVQFYILDFVDDFEKLRKLVYKSKDLFNLITRYLFHRLQKFNSSLFFAIPSKYRLTFCMKYFKNFKKYFPALSDNRILNSKDICGLILILHHIKNPFYFSRSFIHGIKSAFPIFDIKDLFSNHLPYESESTWRLYILSMCIDKRAFYAIEAICQYDRSLVPLTIESIVCKIYSNSRNEDSICVSILEKIKELLLRLLQFCENQDQRKEYIRLILLKSSGCGSMWIFSNFLPLWEYPIHTLDEREHILSKLSYSSKSCKCLLERPDLGTNIVVIALSICLNFGKNSEMATDIICQFPPNTFLELFDIQTITAIQQILIAVSSGNEIANLDINIDEVPRLPIVLASFGFCQQGILDIFHRLITDQVSKELLRELSSKPNRSYFEIAMQDWIRHRGRFSCFFIGI